MLGIFREKQKGHVVGAEWRKERLVENEVREVMELGVVGREHTVFVLVGHNKNSD